ncbi:MAG: Transcription initiation protein spt3 [Alyxoria varia]|nr:MAG: Transcription initiation protein spt3 [Alyxoria varia]
MADKETFKVTEKTAKYRTEIQQVGNSICNDSLMISSVSRESNPGEDASVEDNGEDDPGEDYGRVVKPPHPNPPRSPLNMATVDRSWEQDLDDADDEMDPWNTSQESFVTLSREAQPGETAEKIPPPIWYGKPYLGMTQSGFLRPPSSSANRGPTAPVNNGDNQRAASDVDHAAEASEDDRAYSPRKQTPEEHTPREKTPIESKADAILKWLHSSANVPAVPPEDIAKKEYDEALADLKSVLGNTDSDLASVSENIDNNNNNKSNLNVFGNRDNKSTAKQAQEDTTAASELPRLPGLNLGNQRPEDHEDKRTLVEEFTTAGRNSILPGLRLLEAACKKDGEEKPEDEMVADDSSEIISDEGCCKTMQDFFADFCNYVQQMMFVSGEIGEPSTETTTMIEGIVQQQVIEILSRATELANRAGTKSIPIEHLIFLIRGDKAKVSRLRTFLSWKDVRKNVKDSEDSKGGGGDDFAAGADDLAGGPQGAAQNPADAAAKNMNKTKKAKVRLPWDVPSFYQFQLPEREDDEGDEEEEEMNLATLQRLKNADERTKNMTREEYVHFSECRQASFTFRKGKRFREWAGFGVVTDSKPNDDIVDILGFLTFEIVQTLTEEALKVKADEDAYMKNNSPAGGGRGGAHGGGDKDEAGGGDDNSNPLKRKRDHMGLFNLVEEERVPVQPKHIQEAFRRLQQPDKKMKPFGNFQRHHMRRPLKLI